MTPHLRLKPGAAFPVLAPAGLRILAALDNAARHLNQTLTITSGSETRGRAVTDPHMTGEAVDVSVTALLPAEIHTLYHRLKTALGPAFTVLLEAPPHLNIPSLNTIVYRNDKATALHLHIQRKKGTTWPPPDATSEARRA